MIPYFLLFISIFVMGHIKYKSKKSINNWCASLIFLFMGFRYDVGWDFRWYFPLAQRTDLRVYSIFSTIGDIGIFENLKFQYLRLEIFNKILYQVTWFFNQPQLFFLFSSFIIIFLIKKGLDNKKIYSVYPWLFFLGLPMFMLPFFSIIRQAMAVSLIFYGYKYITSGNLKKFLVTVFLASLFHGSAIFSLPLFFLGKIKVKRKSMFIFFLSSFISLEGIKIILNLGIFSKYRAYITDGVGAGGKIIYFLVILIGIFILIIYNKLIKKTDVFLINAVMIGVYLYISLLPLGDIGPRMALYYYIFLIYLINDILKIFKYKRLVKYTFSVIMLIMLVASLLGDKKNPIRSQYTPYKMNFFEHNKNTIILSL